MPRTRDIKDPWSEDAEKAVLGAILIGAEAMKQVRPMLEPDDFYHSHHGQIYASMIALYDGGQLVDLVTVSARLREAGNIGTIGGAAFLSGLADNCASAANVEHYAKIVKEKATLRGVVSQAREIAIQATQPGARVEDIPERLKIEVSHKAEVNQVSATIKRLNKNIEAGYPGLFPCYDLLARTIRKMVPGHLWVCGGYTSTGKSAWLVDLICRLYAHDMDNPGVAIFSTEMSCEQYLLRMISNRTGVPGWKITEKKMTDDNIYRVTSAQAVLSTRNLYLYDRLYRIEDIERTARMLKARRLDVICIDYIQNLWGEGKIYDRMSRLSPLLQYLAKDLQVTIIALSQVSNEHVRDKGSGVYGYKGAGEIAASADLGIELQRDRGSEMMTFKVEKNRHGRLGEGTLQYMAGFTRLYEVPQERKEEV